LSTTESAAKHQATEKLAFQFCKIATVALILGRYTLLVASGLAAILFTVSFVQGCRRSKCFLRYPLLLAVLWTAVFGVSLTLLLRPDLNLFQK
jgi:hypothetical protein